MNVHKKSHRLVLDAFLGAFERIPRRLAVPSPISGRERVVFGFEVSQSAHAIGVPFFIKGVRHQCLCTVHIAILTSPASVAHQPRKNIEWLRSQAVPVLLGQRNNGKLCTFIMPSLVDALDIR